MKTYNPDQYEYLHDGVTFSFGYITINPCSMHFWWRTSLISNIISIPQTHNLHYQHQRNHLCHHHNMRHYCDVIMGAMASQITSLTIVYSIVHAGADHRNHQRSASLAFVLGIHRWPVNSPHKWPVTRKMFPFDDVIMVIWQLLYLVQIMFCPGNIFGWKHDQ